MTASPGCVVVALGGNAIAAEGHADPVSQQRAVEVASGQIATLVKIGHRVVITHGNGPQVGNLLLKNDLARDVVPPVPLDWCVAQTQATLGYLIVTALETELAALKLDRVVSTVVTRVLVAQDDPAWKRPSKPIGQFHDDTKARERTALGESWKHYSGRGWRRLVPSPEPLEILDIKSIEQLLHSGAIVIAAGGGGIPMIRRDGGLRGVEAVLDKDLSGALLAWTLHAQSFVIATDVQAAATGFGTANQEWIGAVSPARLRELLHAGQFAPGSMAPKVEAAVRFVEHGGQRAVITSLDSLRTGLDGAAGTIVEPERTRRW